MKKTLGKLILYVILWIVAGAALSVVATRIGSDYLHSLAVIGPPMVVGYLSSLEGGEEKGCRLRWWRLVLLIGIESPQCSGCLRNVCNKNNSSR